MQLPQCLLSSGRREQGCGISKTDFHAKVSINFKPLVTLGGVWVVKLSYLQNCSDNDHNICLGLISTYTYFIFFYYLSSWPQKFKERGSPGKFPEDSGLQSSFKWSAMLSTSWYNNCIRFLLFHKVQQVKPSCELEDSFYCTSL